MKLSDLLQKLTLILPLILLVFLLTPNKIHAANSDFKVSYQPFPITTSDKQVTFTIEAEKDGFFLQKTNYSFVARHKGKISEKPGPCKPHNDPFYGGYTTAHTYNVDNTGKKLFISFKIDYADSCYRETGEWYLTVWLGKDYGALENKQAQVILENYPYIIEQPGGTLPQISSVNKNGYGPTQTPQVLLTNAREGTTYSFWWDTAGREFAYKYKADNSGNAILDVNKTGVDFNNTWGNKKLCMEIGDFLTPLGVSCRFSAIFLFLPKDSDNNTSGCSINPANPGTQDSISLIVSGIKPDISYTAYLISDGQSIDRGNINSKQNTTKSVPLSNGLSTGNYSARLSDGSTDFCKIDFSVGSKRSATIPDTIAPINASCENNDCTLAAGQFCDNGGLKTAIGCVPTNIGSLVNQLISSAIGLAGGIALLLMIWGAFEMILSRGDPNALKSGQGRFTSAILGLVFILFSIVLLRIIGVDILGLNCITGGVFGGECKI